MSKSPSDNKDTSTSKAQESNGDSANASASPASTQAEMIKAFQDLARGEQQAAALEASLTSLEIKLDALLGSIEGGPTSSDASQIKESSKEQGPNAEK
ncbi:hypothetical protein F4814DRAFT_286036 [Daldinia grandis]|nr:hypothetical protein F4814DRAFT_286036 [Daldinia grandis]